MIKEAISKLVDGGSLTMDEATAVMDEIMSAEATPAQFGALAMALRMKGETVEEIAGLARAMRSRATPVTVSQPVVDTCGTGGDGHGTFNISTTAAFVVAGAGMAVAKHGNRAMTSQCGSADVLEALGVTINLGPNAVAECIDRVGIGFMFAPGYHTAFKHVGPLRRELGIRTVFNILGPLTNPAGATYQVIGTSNPLAAEKMAGALALLGTRRALVVSGHQGLDEVSICGPTLIHEVDRGKVTTWTVRPEDMGMSSSDPEAIKGGSSRENANITLGVLGGARGPARDIVTLNAAAALAASGTAKDLREGVEMAYRSIESGAAKEKLDSLIKLSKALEARA